MITQIAPQAIATFQMFSQVAPEGIASLQNYGSPQPNRTQHLFESAQQKLQATDSPWLLRIVGFLRISCLLLEEPGAYSKLLKALSEQDQTWWETCEITPAGTLRSSNPAIQQLLAPVLNLSLPTI